MKKDCVSFSAFDLYRDDLLINDGLKFDSGSTIFWQLLCADSVKIATRRQKILQHDYQTLIIRSDTKLPLKPLRINKRYYYVVFLPISILMPSNFSFKLNNKAVEVYTMNGYMLLRESDIAFNVCNTIPDFMKKSCTVSLRSQFVSKLISEENHAALPSLSGILFRERVLSILVFKNLEFFQHDDSRIMNAYTTQLEELIKRQT